MWKQECEPEKQVYDRSVKKMNIFCDEVTHKWGTQTQEEWDKKPHECVAEMLECEAEVKQILSRLQRHINVKQIQRGTGVSSQYIMDLLQQQTAPSKFCLSVSDLFKSCLFSNLPLVTQEKWQKLGLQRLAFFVWNLAKGGGWKYYIKYKGQGCVTSFLNRQQTYRCHLTVISLYACHKAITVR